jgi:hypothetical protein
MIIAQEIIFAASSPPLQSTAPWISPQDLSGVWLTCFAIDWKRVLAHSIFITFQKINSFAAVGVRVHLVPDLSASLLFSTLSGGST